MCLSFGIKHPFVFLHLLLDVSGDENGRSHSPFVQDIVGRVDCIPSHSVQQRHGTNSALIKRHILIMETDLIIPIIMSGYHLQYARIRLRRFVQYENLVFPYTLFTNDLKFHHPSILSVFSRPSFKHARLKEPSPDLSKNKR